MNNATAPTAASCAGTAEQGRRIQAGPLSIALIIIAMLFMAVHLAGYLEYAVAAVTYPFELDYGEGIVWQQVMLIPGPRMYGDINHFPFIVFHYPPFYHLVVRAVAALGANPLIAGRSVSLAASLAAGVLVACLAFSASRRTGRWPALGGAVMAGLCLFSFVPVMFWAPLMRVDMLAIALSLFGVFCAMRSAAQPWLLYIAMIAFVLAAFTKQTCVAAPIATVIVMLFINPRHVIRACGFALAMVILALAILTWETAGGFERHTLLYNINRYSWRTALAALAMLVPHAVFVALAAVSVAAALTRIAFRSKRRVLPADDVGPVAILAAYFLLSAVMLLTVGKSGGGPNYFIEWMAISSVFIGILVARTLAGALSFGSTRLGATRSLALPMALLLQASLLPMTPDRSNFDPGYMKEMSALTERVRAARLPVLSDDMVLLMQAGKQVLWEPAIFAELANEGVWNERQITDMITAHDFAFIITRGDSSNPVFESRYTPAVQRAIQDAYPTSEQQAGRTVHLPPGLSL